MAELANCSRCGAVFVKNIRDICQECYKEEEKAFNVVYSFLRKRENREATLTEIVDATGIEEKLIIKFIKEKRLRTSQFPKLAYPCERCGKNIVTGKLCESCSQEILQDLEEQEKLEQRQLAREEAEAKKNIYYSIDSRNKNQ
ncbi:TIGR03826 family flagellar region protein [Lentibacillus sp. Marseille-P4043]|uniref:TIGR03826 family flagellar region protein n=1 Tax=Lentibacillus sp. Marseille-P4043 TaxID=2040293 RepID=UPI000D0AF404|nr:TIGR03826 family flagellar region protein [Lentibacillus sp. Marseille-P4043]